MNPGHILRSLTSNGESSIQEVAADTNTSTRSVRTAVDHLINRGHVERSGGGGKIKLKEK